MKVAELVAGVTRSNLECDDLARETMRICQGIRTYQNLVSFVLVSVVGGVYLFSLWNKTDSTALLIWYLSFSTLTIIRAWLYESVRRSLDDASSTELMRNELYLASTGFVVSIVLGMSYWVVGIPGDERTALAITVLICVYATGASINSATQTSHLLVYLSAILGQAILFWAGLGNRTDYAMSLLLVCLFVLLFLFANRNRALISESVKMRMESQALNERLLENRVLVENALESALESNRSKSHFIATVSHDLAQPVHALTYLLRSLKSTMARDSDHSDIIEKIEASVGLLDKQFNGFVDLSRYDASDLEVQRDRFDLTEICRVLIENTEVKAAEYRVELRLDGEAAVSISDPILIGRLLGNLLDNAIKFGSDGLVRLQIQPLDHWIVVVIEDQGIGVCKEDLPRIFGDFVRLDAQSRSDGAGLGLSIVHRIAEALGVEVYVDSRVGEGTRFTLLVPVDPTLSLSERALPAVAGLSIREFNSADTTLAVPRISLVGKVILLVDDEPTSADALAGYIHDLGGRSLIAATVEEGLSFAKNNRIDMALVDDLLHGLPSGLRLCQELAEHLAKDKIVMVTGNDSKRRLRDIEKAGFSVYSKPLKVLQLQAILCARLGIGLT